MWGKYQTVVSTLQLLEYNSKNVRNKGFTSLNWFGRYQTRMGKLCHVPSNIR
jgi:hypothetical protein